MVIMLKTMCSRQDVSTVEDHSAWNDANPLQRKRTVSIRLPQMWPWFFRMLTIHYDEIQNIRRDLLAQLTYGPTVWNSFDATDNPLMNRGWLSRTATSGRRPLAGMDRGDKQKRELNSEEGHTWLGFKLSSCTRNWNLLRALIKRTMIHCCALESASSVQTSALSVSRDGSEDKHSTLDRYDTSACQLEWLLSFARVICR